LQAHPEVLRQLELSLGLGAKVRAPRHRGPTKCKERPKQIGRCHIQELQCRLPGSSVACYGVIAGDWQQA
jgi:hypothetical protein